MNNIDAKKRCNYELIVEEFYGLNSGIKETDKVEVDFGSLVNLVCFAHKQFKAEQKQSVGVLKDAFDAGYDYRSSLMPETIEEFGENAMPDFNEWLDAIPQNQLSDEDTKGQLIKEKTS